MLRTKTLRAALLLPAALAVSYISSVTHARAAVDGPTLIQNQLAQYGATDEGKAVTAVTAQANDVVYAVYTVLFNGNYSDADAAAIAAAALQPVAGKARADRSTIAGRIVSAAIYGAKAENNPVRLKAILDAVGGVNNGNTKAALTDAGQELAVAAALRVSAAQTHALPADNSNPALDIGAAIAGSAHAFADSGKELAFVEGVVKQLTTANNLTQFIKVELDNLGASSGDANVQLIAAAAAKQPTIVAGIIAGRAAEISNYTPTAATDGSIKDLVTSAAKNAKLKTAIGGVVAGGFQYLSAAENRGADAAALAADPKLKAQVGQIASGALQALTGTAETPATVLAQLTSSVNNKTLNTFAGQAAVGNASSADDIATYVLAPLPPSTADAANIGKIGVAITNAIATASTADIEAAIKVLAASSRSGDAGKLAGVIAKGAKNNYAAAGAAVGGIAQAAFSSGANATTASTIANGGITGNAKAGALIAQDVAEALAAADPANATANVKNFGVGASTANTKNAGYIAAGVSLADPTNTAVDVLAIVSASGLSKNAVKIATTAAAGADIERVNDIAAAVGTLFQPKGGDKTKPAITTIGTLATGLAKAINTKPLTSSADPTTANAGWHNRVDELGELAAVLTSASLKVAGGQDGKLLATIGSSIMKAVGTKLFANAGNNAADLKDVAQEVAGAIFQTISSTAITTGYTAATRDALLTSTGPLATALVKAAGKTFGTLVSQALTDVNGATGNPGRLVAGSEAVGDGNTVTGTGKYETGYIFDPETPSKNL